MRTIFKIILTVLAISFVVADIFLALLICLVLPKYARSVNHYYPSGEVLKFKEAVERCTCLWKYEMQLADYDIKFAKAPKEVLELLHRTTTTKRPTKSPKDLPMYGDYEEGE